MSATENSLGSSDNNSTLSSLNNNEVLSGGEYKDLNELSALIRVTPNKLDVTEDYQYTNSAITIIKNNYVVDFNGHVIDGNGYDGTLLTVSGNNVTIKNLKFINSNGLPSILWSGDNGVLDNITLTNSYYIEWNGEKGKVTQSSFSPIATYYVIRANGDHFMFADSVVSNMSGVHSVGGSSGEGIVYLKSNCIVSNVNFYNIDLRYTGAVRTSCIEAVDSCMIKNCNFYNCSAYQVFNVIRNIQCR